MYFVIQTVINTLPQSLRWCIWVKSRRCGCLVTWFCYQMIAKPGNKTAAPSWPDQYAISYYSGPRNNGTWLYRVIRRFQLRRWSILRLFMSWLLALPGHQQPWYHQGPKNFAKICIKTSLFFGINNTISGIQAPQQLLKNNVLFQKLPKRSRFLPELGHCTYDQLAPTNRAVNRCLSPLLIIATALMIHQGQY